MKDVTELLKVLSLTEKARLFNGNGSWKTYDAEGKIPFVTTADGPHGVRKQADEDYADLNASKIATCFPTASALASSWDVETIKKLAHALAEEAHSADVDVLLGCGMNIKRSPLCGRNFEYFSEDPYLAGILANEYVKTLQSDGVAACPKHFACNNQELHRMTSNSIVDERTLREIYLRAFEIVVRNSKPKTIMSAYNRVNGKYAGENAHLLTEILRDEWGFDGVVISDWGACINPEASIKAGMDLAMPDSSGYLGKLITKSVENGTLTEAEIERASKNVLKLAAEVECSKKEWPQADLEKNAKIAVELATETAVLLKNDGLLPLKPQEICIIGELAEFLKFQGGGSSHINTPKTPNIIDSFVAKGYKVNYEKGYLSGFVKRNKAAKLNKPYQEKALKLVEECNSKAIPVIFCCGLTDSFEGEGFDRDSLEMPPEQLLLLDEICKITRNVIVLTFAGSAIDFSFEDKVNAILHMHYNGQGVGEAVAILVSGEKSPSGHLSETYPMKIEDTPAFGNYSIRGKDDILYSEEVLVGYRHYQTKEIPVRYEFGYGLTYTTFSYENLVIENASDGTVTANFTLKNTGNFDAAKVAQIYVKNPENKTEFSRANQELRGFAKIFLKAGESKQVSVKLDENAFKVYSTKKNEWTTVGGTYTIQVGSSVKDIRLEKAIDVTGEKLEELLEKFVIPEEYKTEGKQKKFDMTSSLLVMSKKSFIIRAFLSIILVVLRIMNKGASADSPIVKIQINTIKECPVSSLISTSGGAVGEGMAKFFVWCANHRL